MWNRGIRYSIQNSLGEGSQGRVFKALRSDRRSGLRQTVAIKVLHSENAVETWRKEFESLNQVRSPYCVQVFAFERLHGRPSLVLEWVDGVTLQRLAESQLLNPDEISEILAQLEQAVLDLDRDGLFHGDLSPRNVMIDTRGRIRLLDFGLANSSSRAQRLTPDFAAPERLCGAPAGLAADIFSIGCIERHLGANATGSPYLQLSPERRAMRGLRPDSRTQIALGAKVTYLQSLGGFPARDQTKRLELPLSRRVRAAKFLALAMALALLALPGAAPKADFRPHSVLQIRARQWLQVRTRGGAWRFAPLTIRLENGEPLRLEWRSARAAGEKRVRLKPGSGRVLTDRDFSH